MQRFREIDQGLKKDWNAGTLLHIYSDLAFLSQFPQSSEWNSSLEHEWLLNVTYLLLLKDRDEWTRQFESDETDLVFNQPVVPVRLRKRHVVRESHSESVPPIKEVTVTRKDVENVLAARRSEWLDQDRDGYPSEPMRLAAPTAGKTDRALRRKPKRKNNKGRVKEEQEVKEESGREEKSVSDEIQRRTERALVRYRESRTQLAQAAQPQQYARREQLLAHASHWYIPRPVQLNDEVKMQVMQLQIANLELRTVIQHTARQSRSSFDVLTSSEMLRLISSYLSVSTLTTVQQVSKTLFVVLKGVRSTKNYLQYDIQWNRPFVPNWDRVGNGDDPMLLVSVRDAFDMACGRIETTPIVWQQYQWSKYVVKNLGAEHLPNPNQAWDTTRAELPLPAQAQFVWTNDFSAVSERSGHARETFFQWFPQVRAPRFGCVYRDVYGIAYQWRYEFIRLQEELQAQ